MRSIRSFWPYPETKPQIEGPFVPLTRPETGQLLREYITPRMKSLVEIGSFLGMSAIAMLGMAHEESVIYCIDSWLGGSMVHLESDWPEDLHRKLFELFQRNTWDWRTRINPIRNTSVAGLMMLRDYAVKPELIYVDGGHEYEVVRGDLQCIVRYFPHAIVICDDYDWPGVRQAVDEFAMSDRPGFVAHGGNCVFRNP